LLLRNCSRQSGSSTRPVSLESTGPVLMVGPADGDLLGEFRGAGDGGSDVTVTEAPVSSSPCTTLTGCLPLSTLWGSLLELLTGTSEDTSTALGVCWSPILGDGCLLRSPFWKARTDSSLLIEQSKNSYKC
jgi:hypothetical protein